MEIASLVVAIAALAVSGALGYFGYKLNARLVQIEVERREEERQSLSTAHITADVEHKPMEGSYTLVVRNHGPGTAHEVRLMTRLEHRNEGDGEFLPQDAIRRYRFPFNWKTGQALSTAFVEWKHPNGEVGRRHLELP